MVSIFPAAIDTTITLPSALDNITPVRGETVNILRDTIIYIEATLGVKPQGIYATVRARLDALEAAITGTNGSGNIFSIGIPLPGQTIIWNGSNWGPTPNGSNNFLSQNIATTGGILAGPIDSTSETTGLIEVAGKIIVDAIEISASSVSNPGQGIIYYDGYTNQFLVSQDGYAYVPLLSSGAAFTAGGDLSGSNTNQTVIGLQTIPVSATAPTANQVLQFNGTQWIPATLASGSNPTGPAGGDLSGTYPNPTTARLNGALVPAAGSLIDGYVLQVFGSSFLNYAPINLAGGNHYVSGILPAANQASQTMLGDVTGTTATSKVVRINGASVPVSGSLALGNVLQVAGSNALSYGLVDLTLSVSGILSAVNQASQQLLGDVDGYTNAATVIALQGFPVSDATPADGQVLEFVSGTWTPTTGGTTPSGSAGGDLDGYYPNPIVAQLQGAPVSNVSPTNGQYFIFTGGEWTPSTITPVFTAGGDLTGSDVSQTVIAIQGFHVEAASPADGDFLVWSQTNLEWEPTPVIIPTTLPPNGPAGGDLGGTYPNPSVIALQGNPVNDVGPVSGQVLEWDGLAWTPATISTTPSGAAGGDLGGTYPNPSVVKLQGNSVLAEVLGSGEDGYVLTWVNSSSKWEARNAQASGLAKNVRIVTASYAVIATDEVISVGVIGSPITITLPASPLVGETFDIKDGRGSAASNSITVSGNGHLIDGVSSYVIAVNYECITVVWDGIYWLVC